MLYQCLAQCITTVKRLDKQAPEVQMVKLSYRLEGVSVIDSSGYIDFGDIVKCEV